VAAVVLYTQFSAGTEIRDLLAISVAAGAIGSIASVMTRITRGQTLEVRLEGRLVTGLAGAFRPVVGAIFGVAFYVFVQAGLLPLDDGLDEGKVAFFYAGLAFLAGFSERWAQDTVLQSRPITPSPASTRTNLLGGDEPAEPRSRE
jgi:hypothetical protein